ncbi:MAG: hypothetical protein N3B18_11030 [Desulfobacterota bacterium]|nr:hypothetical protein [Thermodesulfobacteriota bacterium]
MKESELFQELQRLAETCGVTVSVVNLKKYSYAIESGMCKVGGKYRIFLDRHLHLSEKIDVLIEALQRLPIDTSGLKPDIKKLFTKEPLQSPPHEPVPTAPDA